MKKQDETKELKRALELTENALSDSDARVAELERTLRQHGHEVGPTAKPGIVYAPFPEAS